MDFNEAQMQAILHKEGPCLVLAGPGSGKTAVLCERLFHLVKEEGVPTEEILVITFTKAASLEMRERFLKKMQEDPRAEEVTFGTFHAVFFQILKSASGFRTDSILLEKEKYEIMNQILLKTEEELEVDSDLVKEILSEISAVKNSGQQIMDYQAKSIDTGLFIRIYQRYEEILAVRKKLDFDDMLLLTQKLFLENAEELRKWQERYRYLLIDEFQDINPLQFEIVKLLALPENNLFVVGDDDQSIYGFRGSDPGIMLDFPKEYEDCKQILLNINYRSCRNIVQNAIEVINHNEKRFFKEITAFQKEMGTCKLLACKDTVEEALLVGKQMLEEHEKVAFQEMAILLRSNSQMSIFAAKLSELGIPFSAGGQIQNVFEHWILADLFAFFDLAEEAEVGVFLRSNLLKVMNRPKRYLMRESLQGEEVRALSWLSYYRNMPEKEAEIIAFLGHLEGLHKLSPYAGINYIRRVMGYDRFLADYAREHGRKADELLELLDLLQEHAKNSRSIEAWRSDLAKSSEAIEEEKKRRKNSEDGVRIMTMHSSKGLEFHSVYIVDAIESITPFRRAKLKSEIEEERRLFYVAMTRAKKNLYLCLPEDYRNHKTTPSRFLAETQDFKVENAN